MVELCSQGGLSKCFVSIVCFLVYVLYQVSYYRQQCEAQGLRLPTFPMHYIVQFIFFFK